MKLCGYVLVLLNVVNVISAVSTCYPVNGQQYCFYTDGSTVLNWDEARQFCLDRNSTLPIVTDDNIDNVFQQFISENNLVEVSDSNTQQMNNYVWLDAHARQVSNSDPWHWINGQPSALHVHIYENIRSRVVSISGQQFYETPWTYKHFYICQYQSNCTSTWVETGHNAAVYHQENFAVSASTLKQCQEACEFYYRCVAINWKFSQGRWVCALITYPNHEHREESHIYSTHYELVSRCNITSETSCENGFVYKSTCYKIHIERVNWFTAVNRCLSYNASLAVFDDHIHPYFSFLLPNEPLWIGLMKSWWTWPDADCVTWTIEEDYGGAGDKNYTATTVEDCRTECNNNGSCTAIDWIAGASTGRQCWLVGPWTYWSGYRHGIHRHTISRCDVLYHKFNVTSWNPPANPPYYPISDYNCVVATSRYWRLSRCTDRHRVVCQSVGTLTTATSTITAISKSTSQFSLSPDDSSSTPTGVTTSSQSGLPVTLIVVIAVVVPVVVIAAIAVVVVVTRRRRHRGEQSKPKTEESTGQTSLSMTSSSFDPSNPDVVYANIKLCPQSASSNGDVNPQNTPGNDQEAVIYSELQRKDATGGHTVAPSGDLYAEVQ